MQYGLRHGRSTADLRASVNHSWRRSLKSHCVPQVIALDIPKSFGEYRMQDIFTSFSVMVHLRKFAPRFSAI